MKKLFILSIFNVKVCFFQELFITNKKPFDDMLNLCPVNCSSVWYYLKKATEAAY